MLLIYLLMRVLKLFMLPLILTATKLFFMKLERFSYYLFLQGSDVAQEKIEKLKVEIEKNKARLSTAQEMLLDKTIDAADFRHVESKYENAIYELEKRLQNMSQENNELDGFFKFGR